MLRSYLIIAFRNLIRNSFFSAINIGGLAAGITCTILIMLWVIDELTFDHFHENGDRLAQVWVHDYFTDDIGTGRAVSLPLYEHLKTANSGIKNTAVSDWGGQHLVVAGDQRLIKRGFYVSPEFLEMFRFPLIRGEASKALDDISSVVITESLAKLLFKEKDPINQIIQLDNETELKVTGVLKDIPDNSSLKFDILIPWAINAQQDWIKRSQTQWDNQSFQVYVELQPDAKMEEIDAAIVNILNEKVKDARSDLFLLPLYDWRLHSSFVNGKRIGGASDYVTLFSAIATFILVIACINFMNLATARSERRAREVGVRKAIGSSRKELVQQFLGESFLIAFIAFLFAMLLVQLALPFYNNLVDKHLSIELFSPVVWMVAIVFVVFTGLFAGSYPAFYLSAFNPAKVLKGKLQMGNNGVTLRKSLVVVQFFCSIFLIGSTFSIYQQINFVKERHTGYDKENLIMVFTNDEMTKNFQPLKNELMSSGVVQSMTSSESPITEIYGNNTMSWPGKPQDKEVLFSRVTVEYSYSKTMGIKVIDGRDFSEEFRSDSSGMLLNRAAADAIGLQNPIGTEIDLWGRKWKILGVLENTLMESPFREVRPGFYLHNDGANQVITIRMQPTSDMSAAVSKVESIFKKHNPSYAFSYQFVDETYAKKFASIEMIGTLSNLFAFLAIFITCLGLYGLAAFSAEQRIKEIGIRKVMGASTASIVTLMSKDFAYLVMMGFALATPLAWWAIDNYLKRFDYRVSLEWWILPTAGALALLLVLVIVSSQALRASRANPADSLRSE